MKPMIHFAHANGIPAPCYNKLLDALRDQYTVYSAPNIGTDARYPVTDQWHYLVDQILESIKHQAENKAVIAVGHSLGALLSYMAAVKNPHLFQCVIMLDPPLIMGAHCFGLHLTKHLGHKVMDRFTPAKLSARRQDHWQSREYAYKRLRHRGFFKTFDEQCFQDYIRFGLQDDPIHGGVTLTIPKATEVEIFRCMPSLWWKPQKRCRVPVYQLVAEDSPFHQQQFPQKALRKLNIPFDVVPGGHMFPLESPLKTAQDIKHLILRLNAQVR